MRARNLKPSLFKNELLAVSDPLHTVIFAGLWCMADRGGRLEDRPARIHIEINPGRRLESTQKSLKWLNEQKFIVRYQAGNERFIQVVNFTKHQNPHVREPASLIPAPDENSASTVPSPEEHRAGPADSGFLIPDSPSLIPDCSLRERRARQLPEDFSLTEPRRKYAAERLANCDVPELFEAFTDHHRGKGTVARDWDATWHTWVRRALNYGYPTLAQRSTTERVIRYDANGREIRSA